MGSSNSLLLSHLLVLLLLPAARPDLAAERAALIALRAAVGGRTLRWNSTLRDPCSWEGVTCDSRGSPRVIEIRLPADGLSGNLPPNVFGNLTHLRTLSLRQNSLSGEIPPDLGSCAQLRRLILQENRFSGEIPASLIANLSKLQRLDLAGNEFTGGIPPEFIRLTGLKALNLGRNQLTGPVPDLPPLKEFNVSNNKLNGSIPIGLRNMPPASFYGNSLCGFPLNPCPVRENTEIKSKRELSGLAIAGIVIGAVVGPVLIAVILFMLCRKFSKKKKVAASLPSLPSKHSDFVTSFRSIRESCSGSDIGTGAGSGGGAEDDGLVFFGIVGKMFDMRELLEASAEVMGRGEFGTTYKASLQGGDVVVKRLRNVCVPEREFREKAEKLGTVSHENLFPFRGYFFGKEEKLLLYDSAPMGSLSALLHGTEAAGPVELSWEMRTSIAIGVAHGIEHLHSLGLSHGNVKSSNIFPTKYPGALLSEFGVSQLVLPASSADAPGVAPKADIYRFGVLLLELVTGKAPTEDPIQLPTWVGSVAQEKWAAVVFDPKLVKYRHDYEQHQMVKALQLALDCASEFPEKRPAMTKVRRQVEGICKFVQ